jgi:hypothetical protein
VDGALTWATSVGGICQAPNFIYCSDEIGNFGTGPSAWGTGPITNATLPDYTYFEYVRVYDTNSPVSIIEQPQSTNAALGDGASFNVVAFGSPPLSYQWQFDGTNIFGATDTNYLILNIQLTNSGNYAVVITNIVGSITSNVAALNVLESPSLLSPGVATNGEFTFTLNGLAGYSYEIDATTNLSSSNWIYVATISNAMGLTPFTETNTQSYPFLFYRAKLLIP